jgi:hypothetical protein
MASVNEQRATQTHHYYVLLSIQAQNSGMEIKGLREALSHAKAVMTEPEISWVEKQIAEVYKS